MRKSVLVFFVAITFLAVGASNVMAWSVDLYNIDEDTLGLQFLVDEGETLTSWVYQFNVIPDDGYLSSTHTTLSGMMALESPETHPDAATDEKVGDWLGATFGVASTVTEDSLFGTVTFDHAVTAGQDIFWGYEHIDFGANLNLEVGNVYTGVELYNGGHLSYNGVNAAVPVPAAVWLLGSGLLGLVGLRRREKK